MFNDWGHVDGEVGTVQPVLIRYEICDETGRLMWRSVDVEDTDEKMLAALERSVTVPDGGQVLAYADGKLSR